MKNYNLDNYIFDIDKYGLKKTWRSLLQKTLKGTFISDIFNVDNYGELYEIGLERVNAISKKEMGKYYTPRDVAEVMSKWLIPLKGKNVCDIGCGTGNLILTYLDALGRGKSIDLLRNGCIYLYDIDEVALEICRYSIAIKYGKEYLKKVHCKKCDFLDKNVRIPRDSKVISNPPYYKITSISENWTITNVILQSKEFYSSFMEKILKKSLSSVIITPYSFIGSTKFYTLRKLMNKYNGFVVSFDNVPGNIFNGRKHGIFNSNTGNSVRAAITVVENKEHSHGFRFSPLIRFKSEERTNMMDNTFLLSLVNDRYQTVCSKHNSFYKCHNDLLHIFDTWQSKSNRKLRSLLSSDKGYKIYLPTTCRYFTVGSKSDLCRDGKRIIYIKDKNKYNFVYCLMNSSFAYWYWRLYDGGINCALTIINSIPIFYDLFNKKQMLKLDKIATKMQSEENKYHVYKLNAGKMQENIKFPKKYRDEINSLFFEVLGISDNVDILDKIHSSSLFNDKESEPIE